MKGIAKKITALGMASVVALTACINANAAFDFFDTTSDYDITFRLDANISAIAGAAYKLDAEVIEINEHPYYYPTIYIKSVLFGSGTGSDESSNYRTFNNAYKGSVYVTRGVGSSNGHGYGYFSASGNNAYGNVVGMVPTSM